MAIFIVSSTMSGSGLNSSGIVTDTSGAILGFSTFGGGTTSGAGAGVGAGAGSATGAGSGAGVGAGLAQAASIIIAIMAIVPKSTDIIGIVFFIIILLIDKL
jgi:hypothetical protein